MPTSITTSMLALSAILTTVDDTASVIVGAAAVVWEVFITGMQGSANDGLGA